MAASVRRTRFPIVCLLLLIFSVYNSAHDPHETESGHSHEHSHAESTKVKSSEGNVWTDAIGATVLISAAPFVILFVIPLDKGREGQESLLKVLLSFASGGLLGDAFLHLIPHSLSPHSHGDHGHDHEHEHQHHEHEHSHDHGHSHGHDHSRPMLVGFWVLVGIILFLLVEKFVRLVKGDGAHSHSHGHTEKAKVEDDGPVKKGDSSQVRRRKTGEKEEAEKHEKSAEQEGDAPIKVAAYLNLVADCTHNFTDGLAIGASFLAGRNVGIVTTITILLHEVPHEIGDFAILVQSGCNKRKAMYLQLLTAVGALAGCICALLAEGAGDTTSIWVLPITAGGFIYIACVTVIPELLGDTTLKQSIMEIAGLLAGVGLMYLIALYE
ncbi:protein catecholamines up [Strongylocentrotus purpuratus]|uniref:Uncharacterized protein n=1 Tax=Strongylocentrotus purpuratus TaxID=7668 RepID=A0A7M7PR84_STRPU|nr:protein catecholamines up [Strongylocentrotus purpuratus]